MNTAILDVGPPLETRRKKKKTNVAQPKVETNLVMPHTPEVQIIPDSPELENPSETSTQHDDFDNLFWMDELVNSQGDIGKVVEEISSQEEERIPTNGEILEKEVVAKKEV